MNYLALGDSYTIGEGVEEKERWPSVLVEELNSSGFNFRPPQIIATTGWTTAELLTAIEHKKPGTNFDLVSLLIGVNNQYRGLSMESSLKEFELLLTKAIAFAAGRKNKVFVMSIPDYSVTPYARALGRQKISDELEAYNVAQHAIANRLGVKYFNITPISQLAADDMSLLASDELHPSGKMYRKWVSLIVEAVKEMLEEGH